MGRRDAAEILDGEWRESRGRKFLVVERKYSPGYRHGRLTLADCLPPWRRLHLLTSGTSPSDSSRRDDGATQHTLFIDLETTGLAGGAGTYAFLVGCGWFEPPSPLASAGQLACFRTRQFFLADFGAERALLEAVGELASNVACVVTYNGKTFDLPLLETRFSLQRMPTPFAEVVHVDMLHPARRMWRQEDIECRLTYLEQALCGHEREGDVPGFEIPSRYFQYVRSGDARPIQAVFEHNRLDIVSLAMLTARAAQLLDEGPSAAITSREALGMGRLYERAGLLDEALKSFARATEADIKADSSAKGSTETSVEALRASAILLRRLRRFEEASTRWRELLVAPHCPPAYAREANEALAVHHEHRARDLEAARMFAVQSLTLLATPAHQQATRHRLARLDRKLAFNTLPRPTAPLFREEPSSR
jgi:uncharacterized protein YprB with RNaseH-like and TPR domain